MSGATIWQPHREPWRATLRRNLMIAVIGGGAIAFARGRVQEWPTMTVLMLWPAFGGHFLEMWFLNRLRPRLPRDRAAQLGVRLALWFAGGIALLNGAALTAFALRRPFMVPALPWWGAGLGFIAVELVAHGALAARGRPSVYDVTG